MRFDKIGVSLVAVMLQCQQDDSCWHKCQSGCAR